MCPFHVVTLSVARIEAIAPSFGCFPKLCAQSRQMRFFTSHAALTVSISHHGKEAKCQ